MSVRGSRVILIHRNVFRRRWSQHLLQCPLGNLSRHQLWNQHCLNQDAVLDTLLKRGPSVRRLSLKVNVTISVYATGCRLIQIHRNVSHRLFNQRLHRLMNSPVAVLRIIPRRLICATPSAARALAIEWPAATGFKPPITRTARSRPRP
jgi:hypothetical protein